MKVEFDESQFDYVMDTMKVCFTEHQGIKTVDIYPDGVEFKCAVCGRVFGMSLGMWEVMRSFIPPAVMPKERKRRERKNE